MIPRPRSLAVVACEVFTREVCALVASSPCEISLCFLPKGLHGLPCMKMRERIQTAVNEAARRPGVDGIAVAYGMCNRGLEGISGGALPLAIPRAHDCISVFLGSPQRHERELAKEPGTYFLSSGWIEHSRNSEALTQLSVTHRNGMDLDYAELVRKYGEENADYLKSTMGQTAHYKRCAYIHLGVEPDERFASEAQRRADGNGWRYEKLEGDLTRLRHLLHGEWDDPGILVVPPRQRIVARFDADIAAAEPIPAESDDASCST